MKQTLKSGLFILFGLIGVVIVGVLAMFLGEICPPQGPWPQPPWCQQRAEPQAVAQDEPIQTMTAALTARTIAAATISAA